MGLGDSKVEQLDPTIRRDLNIRGFDVAVEDAKSLPVRARGGVGRVQCIGNLVHNGEGRGRRHGTVLSDALLQGAARDVLHDQGPSPLQLHHALGGENRSMAYETKDPGLLSKA